jgi:cystathionine beta-lyase
VRWETECVQYEPSPSDPFAPSTTPIYQTATFRLDSQSDFDYSRSGNPTRRVLEEQLARLEDGTHGFAFASGMAAITACTSLAEAGDEIVASIDLYGGSHRLFSKVLPRQGVRVRRVDSTNEKEMTKALDRRPRLVYVETPSNPFQRITDLERIAELAHAAEALLVVDNSMMSPYLQRPLQHGADLVLHSATKFLCGHSDVTAGAVVVRDAELAERVAFYQNAAGNALAPFEAFLLARGMKTLPLRIDRQQATAELLAEDLYAHPRVRAVHFAGLQEHPGYDVHHRQARGGGAVISFRAGSEDSARSVVEQTKLFATTVSFGGVRSTISLPSSMSHESVPDFPRDLVRLSIGIEHPDDLRDDLARALE